MKTKSVVWLACSLLVLLSIGLIPLSCDFTRPQRVFRLAVPQSEYFYNYMAGHMKPFLERLGYKITIVPAADILEASRMVAEGRAELTMVNNHSATVVLKLGYEASNLRTVMPITSRIMFAFTRKPLRDSATAIDLFKNKRVAIESIGGETHLTLKRFFSAAKINDANFVTFKDSAADVVVFWDRFYGERAESWKKKGWHPIPSGEIGLSSSCSMIMHFGLLNCLLFREMKMPLSPTHWLQTSSWWPIEN